MPTEEYTRRDTLGILTTLTAAGVIGTGTVGATTGGGHNHNKNGATLNRFATTVAGAEFTGIFLTRDG